VKAITFADAGGTPNSQKSLMTSSDEAPVPSQETLLRDLIVLLEKDPAALQQLKKSLEAAPHPDESMPGQAPGTKSPPLPVGPPAPQVKRSPVPPRMPAGASNSAVIVPQALQPPPGIRPLVVESVPEAADPPIREDWFPQPATTVQSGLWERIGGGPLTFAVLFHLILLIVGAFWIFQIIQEPEKKVDFLPSGEGGGERGAQTKIQRKKQAQITPATQVKRVFAEGASSNFAMPDPGDNFGEMSPLSSLAGGGMSGGLGGSGFGGGFGSGRGNGAGSALGGAGAGKLFGPLSLFGQKGSNEGIQGSFRDFKMDKRKKPTGNDPSMDGYRKILQAFRLRGWEGSRWKNFESPTKLNAKFFYFPAIEDRQAGPAFDCGDCGPGLWVAHYRGRIKASAPGKYRFIGWGDNLLAVKIGREVVLDASDAGFFLDGRECVGSASFPNKASTPIYTGTWLNFGDRAETIEVVLGDQGGIFCAGLFIQPEGVPLTFGPGGIPRIPLFLMGSLSEGERNLLKGVAPESLEGPVFTANPESNVRF
jgi:hypothetical protein